MGYKDITQVVISYEVYQTSLQMDLLLNKREYCSSYDLSRAFYRLLSGHYFKETCIVVTDVLMTLLVPAESDNTPVVMTLFMT